jgi:GT2 family glycosyltransferase
MPKKVIHVEIVSPVHNRCELTLQCLKSLSRVDKTGLKIHVIIVDDGSTDGTGEAIKNQFPETEIVRGDGNLWFTGGANRGFEAALKHNPDYILLINNDTVFDDQFLLHLVNCAETHERSVIGGLLLLWDEPHRVFQVAPKWETLYGGWRHLMRQTVWTVPQKPFDVDFIAGNCILFPAQVFRENGLMNERWVPHYADAEYTPRIKKNGWRLLIEPRARIFNQPNALPPSVAKMNVRQIYNVLWKDLSKPQNLRWRFVVYWVGAPTKFQAIAGFAIYVARYGLYAAGLDRNWQKERDERKLSEDYV